MVTKRIVQKPVANTSTGVTAVARQGTPQSAEPSSRASSVAHDVARKRKVAANTDAVLPPAKKSRLSPSPGASRAPSATPSLRASVVSSRHSSLAPAAEDVRSRAGSVVSDVAARRLRECWTAEDGRAPDLLSAEQVIKGMVKTYKACEYL